MTPHTSSLSSASTSALQRALLGLGCLAVLALAIFAALLTGATSIASGAPAGRAYEMVSPVDKNGGDIAGIATNTRAARDGTAVSFISYSGFGDVTAAGLSFEYMSQRTPTGWVTHSIQPRQEPQPASMVSFSQNPYYIGEFSDDLSMGIVRALSPLTNAPNVASTRNLYLRRDLRTPGPGTYELLTDSATPIAPAGTPGNPNGYKPFLAAASHDFTHVIFESRLNLTADAPPQPPGCALNFGQCLPRLYEVTGSGSVRLAGIMPDGTPAVSSSAGQGPGALRYTDSTLTRDGQKVFFTAPVSTTGFPTVGSRIYMRSGGSVTVEVSASERTDCAGDSTCNGDGQPDPAPDPAGPAARASFGGATPDGAKVIFSTAEQLTDDDANDSVDLYMYDATLPSEAPDNLQLLSGGLGSVRGVFGLSDAGTHVYFAVEGAAGDEIILWRNGEIRNIGGIDPLGTQLNAGLVAYTIAPKVGRVSSDGRVFAFQAEDGAPLTGYDHGTDCDRGALPGCTEVYVYDADGNGGAGELKCASCNPNGEPATSDAETATLVASGASPFTEHQNRFLTSDGKRVFFTTGDSLVPGDRNGKVRDVYMYDVESEAVSLISTGRGSADSSFMDASASGDDVFFVTREALVGWDNDKSYDLYNARIGGGFPEPVAPPPGCAGDACQGPDGLPPVARSLTSSIDGRGNLKSSQRKRAKRVRCAKNKRKLRRSGKVRCVKKNARMRKRATNTNRRANR